MRKTKFAIKEYYHLYNRGVDKRIIFEDKEDLLRFLSTMKEFNTVQPLGSLYPNNVKKQTTRKTSAKLVQFVTYCLNQNHFHFLVEPLVDDGVPKFMHRLSTGYTNYFNEKYKRSGSLFQGRYKAIHIDSNEYLVHLSVYINLNNQVHRNVNPAWIFKLPFSGLGEYVGSSIKNRFCDTAVVLKQFASPVTYLKYARKILPSILMNKESKELLRRGIIE